MQSGDCERLYKYIASLDKDFIIKNNLGDIFIKNLEMTQFCDHKLNLENERKDITKQINSIDSLDANRYQRLLIKNQEPTWSDSLIATATFMEHFDKIRLMMIDVLPLNQRIPFVFKDWAKRNFIQHTQ